MIQIKRNNVFETNSSSEHTLTISNNWEIRELLDDIKYVITESDDKDDLYDALGKLERIKALLLRAIEEN